MIGLDKPGIGSAGNEHSNNAVLCGDMCDGDVM